MVLMDCQCSLVVNSFQISIFDFQATAYKFGITFAEMLWIAFKLVSLTFKQQPIYVRGSSTGRCE